LIVFLLHDEQGEVYSFLSVQIDGTTIINTQSCGCRNNRSNNSSCCDSVLERSGGLIARCFEKTSLRDWNVAAMGTHQAQNQPELTKYTWIKIAFPDARERKKFVDCFDEARKRYLRSVERYNEAIYRTQEVHLIRKRF
jgi:hypothetical protein